MDLDYIEVLPNSYEIKRKRNGITKTEKSNTSIPLGWVNMNISVSKQVLSISPYIENITPEYQMQHLIIASQYLASCPEGTPSWKIASDKAVIVPLNGQGRSKISFKSEKEFSPFITIISYKYYLTYESGIILGTNGTKLPANTYSFIVENEYNTIRLLYQE
ncbi:unnamed protein product, partial [Meganyctiphanes norvegica]